MTSARTTLVLEHLVAQERPIVVDALRDRLQALTTTLADPHTTNGYVLRVWRLAAAEDWPEWAGAIVPEEDASGHDRDAAGVVTHLFRHYGDLHEEGRRQFPDYISAVLGLTPHGLDDYSDTIQEAVQEALYAAEWWSHHELREGQRRLHDCVRRLAEAGGAPAAEKLLGADVRRALATATAEAAERLAAARQLAEGLPSDELRKVAESVVELPVQRVVGRVPTPLNPHDVVYTRATLAAYARGAGASEWQNGAFAISKQELIDALTSGEVIGHRAVATALHLRLPPGRVRQIFEAADYSLPAPVATALESWARDLRKKDRTALIEQLVVSSADSTRMIKIVAANYASEHQRADERRLVTKVRELMEKASNWHDRRDLAKKVAAIEPSTGSGQKELARLIEWLLGRDRPKKDVEVALTALLGLRQGHEHKRTLDRCFAAAARKAERKATHTEVEAFERAGLAIPRELVRKSLWEKLFGG